MDRSFDPISINISASGAEEASRERHATIVKEEVVNSLERGLAVIAAFDQQRPWLTIAEVALRCSITRAAARRYLLTLEKLGYVSFDRKMYALTAKILRLGQSYMHSARLPKVIQPALADLSAALQEASSAGVLDGDDVISIAATTGGRPVSATIQPGTRVPAYCTANGRVLLAALPAVQVQAWVLRQDLRPLTQHTITSSQRLIDEIDRVRAVGYALVDQEFEAGLRTLAVPLKNYRGEVIASINISAHASRMTLDRLVDHCLPALLEAQRQLTSVM